MTSGGVGVGCLGLCWRVERSDGYHYGDGVRLEIWAVPKGPGWVSVPPPGGKLLLHTQCAWVSMAQKKCCKHIEAGGTSQQWSECVMVAQSGAVVWFPLLLLVKLSAKCIDVHFTLEFTPLLVF